MTPPAFSLQGQQALVIGGGSGIGRALALGLAAAGATVGVVGRRSGPLHETCRQIAAGGGSAWAASADAREAGQLRALAARAAAETRSPDVLVNAQGVMHIADALAVGDAAFDEQIETNLRSVWLACTTFGAAMLARGSGAVINVASVASLRGMPRNAVYAASKHAVAGITTSLAAEWAPRGVRVNALVPGFFVTDLNRDTLTGARLERALSRVPMGRVGRLDELAGAAVFLASPAASYVTGTLLAVDGGCLAAGM